MKPRYIRVALDRANGWDTTAWKIRDMATGHDIARLVPIAYERSFREARRGDRLRVNLYTDPPRLRYRKGGHERRDVLTVPAILRFAEVIS